MEPVAERRAFARAWSYLNYNAPAKWTALVMAVITGVLYVAMLAVLWLFADLMVHRGRIPSYADLGPQEQAEFAQRWLEQSPRGAALEDLGLEKSSHFQRLGDADPADLSPEDQSLVWRAYVYRLLRDRVGGQAAMLVLPSYQELPPAERDGVLAQWQAIPIEERRKLFEDLAFPAGVSQPLVTADRAQLNADQQETVWLATLFHLYAGSEIQAGKDSRDVMHDRLAILRERLTAGPDDPLPALPPSGDAALTDRGILSLLVRTSLHGRLYMPIVGALARMDPWMWKPVWGGRNYLAYLTGLLVIVVALGLLWALAAYAMREAAARAVIEGTTRLRRAVYHHTFRLGTLAFRALGPSEAVTVFARHVEAVHDGLYYWITVFFREPVKFGLLLAFALLVNPWLGLAFLCFALLIWLIGRGIQGRFRKEAQIATNQAAERLTLIRESLMLMRLVKTYMMELFNQSRVERQLSRYAAAQQQRYHGQAIYPALLPFLALLAGAVLLFVAGLNVLSGRLGVAGAITLAVTLVSLYWPLTDWLGHLKYLRRARESAVQLFQFLDRPGEVGQVGDAEFLQPLSKQLEFDNVTFKEPGTGRTLLQEVSFTVPYGQRIGIVGPDDQEKHALVYLIPRLLDPNNGEIRIDDHNLRWVTLDSLRAQIAVVLQHDLIFHDSVANNISCGDPAYTLPQIIEAAKTAHAHHFIQKLPQGYETVIGEQGHPLDVGQTYRIALARAILRDPALLIIEEPEQTLDEDVKSQVDDTFARFLPERTVIFLPHRISTIRSCNQVYLLHRGRIEAQGEHRELLSSSPLYRHLHYLEFAEIAEQV